jgi:hypothetical protein
MLSHAIEQMRKSEGVRDMLEDDIEHQDQAAAKVECRACHISRKDQQATVHSRIEASRTARMLRTL